MERVLAAMAESREPLDDDRLARRAGINTRQTVNQICRRLHTEGLIMRVPGPDGKIVNSIIGRPMPPARDVALAEPPPAIPAGSSTEQRTAEGLMLIALGKQLDVQLAPRRIEHVSGARAELDGADEALTILVECWAHQGTAKVAQKYKLVNDAVKLSWVGASLPARTRRLIICVSDEAAVRHLRGRSWQGQAIAHLGVEIVVVELSADVVAAVTTAQVRQYR